GLYSVNEYGVSKRFMMLFGSRFYCCRVPALRFKQSSRLLDDTRIEPCLHL
uniref:Uncharacterized protein n=1 Tax=Triticum urartu TaxID=4572 RepID=A0A8R7UNX2_TRIUA